MYNKIFTKILDSSIWLETDTTRIVWLTLIASMDETGFCQFAALGNLAGRARVALDQCRQAAERLEAPDAESGDPANDGRRIERVPGGWIVLNAEKYRAIVTRAVNQEQTRARVARFRARNKGVTHGNAGVTVANGSVTPSEAGSESESENTERQPSAVRTRDPLFDALAVHTEGPLDQIPRKKNRAIGVALAEIRAVCPTLTPGEIARRAENYRLHMPNVTLTANALASHWARCDKAPAMRHQNPAPTDEQHSHGF